MRPRHLDLNRLSWVLVIGAILPAAASRGAETRTARDGAHGGMKPEKRLNVHLSWGHRSPRATQFRINLAMRDGAVEAIAPRGLEEGDTLSLGPIETWAGGGDVDSIAFTLRFEDRPVVPISNPHVIWKHLLEYGNADAARRLRLDPGFRPDSRKLTVTLDAQGARGFSVTVDQLLTSRVFWVPDLDIYLSTGESPVPFDQHRNDLATSSGPRVLAQVERDPEWSYEDFKGRWEDMGSASYRNPAAIPPGHIVCLSWDGSLHKFGIDRNAGVHSDLGSTDRFKLTFDFGKADPKADGSRRHSEQRLTEGLPVIVTHLERGGVRFEIEQFCHPLDGPPARRDGDVPMVHLQKVVLRDLEGKARTVPIRLSLQVDPKSAPSFATRAVEGGWLWEDPPSRGVRLAISGRDVSVRSGPASGTKPPSQALDIDVALPAGGVRELGLRLPSPRLPPSNTEKLLALDYESARTATLRFWSEYLARGARFQVPEPAVNVLFRANLWHALRLPRRHGSGSPAPRIDLPYSNFAYGQEGTPWPINQAVYVDYMLYDLRGHHDLAQEELAAMYRENQEPDGHVGGFANWGVYTPGMIYAVSQHYLLTRDRAALDALLPRTLKALDWCLSQAKRAGPGTGPRYGLMLAPLNDLTKEARAWAFNQAYLFAALDLLGRVLEDIQHPRAGECRSAAVEIRDAIRLAFGRAATESPLVQLRDRSWIPYVPSDALTPGRLMETWYPTDVDTGALHLSRLVALDPDGPLTSSLLHDHEDNLFLQGWGMANEPVYNQQATAYLLRDEVKPAIRAFYSMMACAFSHSVFEPVEHRWGWGQYFGPPSTDGAWFELYRRMLIHERDDDTLLLLQATPRRWLEEGKSIEVSRAPTYFGPLSMTVTSHSGAGEIHANIALTAGRPPKTLLVRLRHPRGKPIRSVSFDGRAWADFDAPREWVRIEHPAPGKHEIISRY